MERHEVVIVGAGFAGGATAWHLAERGATDVVILEREAVPGVHSSGRNAALVRDTVAITVLHGSEAVNMIPPVASADLDARLLPGETCENFTRLIEQTLADPALGVEPLLAFDTRSSPTDSPLYRAIAAVAASTDADTRSSHSRRVQLFCLA